MARCLCVVVLFCVTLSYSDIPPEIEWEVICPGVHFRNILQAANGDLLLAGYSVTDEYWSSLFRYSETGQLIWGFCDLINPHPCIYTSSSLLTLQDSSIVVTGTGYQRDTSSLVSLAIAKVSKYGERIWTRVYQFPHSKTRGYHIEALPDGGFAICGEIDPESGMNQAITIRTDSQGDTLWTREWGWSYNDKALTVLYVDNGLTVLMNGRTDTTPGGPHLVRYDMSGNLIWERYVDFPYSGPAPQALKMCRASSTGFFILVQGSAQGAVHTDLTGNVIWPSFDGEIRDGKDFCYTNRYHIAPSMDGGFLYCGETHFEIGPGGPAEHYGWVQRTNSDGSSLWNDRIYTVAGGGCDKVSCVYQLPQGGYIASGYSYTPEDATAAFIVKYSPELGMEEVRPAEEAEIVSISPNPFSSSTSIRFSLPESGIAHFSVFDLQGRVVDTISEGFYPAGGSSLVWTISETLSSGCYLLHLESPSGSFCKRVVVLD